MTCAENQILLQAVLDGELDARHACEVQAHIAGCPGCGKQLRNYRALREAMSTADLEFTAPASLRGRIEAALRSRRARPRPSRRMLLQGFATGSMLSAAVTATVRSRSRSG
jgi:anti-sigma factor RsiW